MTTSSLSEVTDVVLVDARRSTRGDTYRAAQIIAQAFLMSGMTLEEAMILGDVLQIEAKKQHQARRQK